MQLNFIDINKKISTVGNTIIKLIANFSSNSYDNKLIVGNLLISQFTAEYTASLIN